MLITCLHIPVTMQKNHDGSQYSATMRMHKIRQLTWNYIKTSHSI